MTAELYPAEFEKVVRDFIADLKTTFPEYSPLINKWWTSNESESLCKLFDYCKTKLPPRFFDILYKNDDIFAKDSIIDTEFLPYIHFKNLWQSDITESTRDTIWKYLQLIMFSIVETLTDKSAFGDTSKLFEAINEETFKSKLEETLGDMGGLFESASASASASATDLPDAEQMHEHIKGMMDGKLGKFAREIAEETAESMSEDLHLTDTMDVKDVFAKLLKNPSKLMGLVKTVGEKLESKLKSGEIKESEMLQEATDMMNKMKDMPGMGGIQAMLQKMGMGGKGKVNVAAMEANLAQKIKMAKTKERIRARAELNAKMRAATATASATAAVPLKTDAELIALFSGAEKIEKTPRNKNKSTVGEKVKDKKKKKK